MIPRILKIVLACLVALISTAAWPQQGWEQFALEPLEIIYPEQEALSNPPFLHWQPVGDAVQYKVRLRGQEAVWEWTNSYNFYTPEEPLAPGFYTLELAAFDSDDKQLELGTNKSFQITKPGSSYHPALNEIRFEKGRSILFPDSILQELRKASGERAEYRERLLSHASGPLPELLKDIKEPEPYENGVWNFPAWKKNNALCFVVEEYLLHQTLAYTLSGEKKYLDNARAVISKVVEWDPAGSTGVWENDHSAQALLHSLSIAYNRLGDKLPVEEKEKLARAIEGRSKDMYAFLNPFIVKNTSAGPMNDPDNNHPWFCTSALGYGALALMGEAPEAEAWLAFCAQMFNGCYLPRGGRSGGWHEGIEYWSYNLFFVFQFCDALKEAAGIDLYQHPWLKHTALFKIYVQPPQGGYVPFGDCKHHSPNEFDKVVMMRLASVYEDPLAWRYISAIPEEIPNSRLFYALLWGDRKGSQRGKLPEIPFAQHFEDIGWVVSNNNLFEPDEQILFAFHSGKFFGRRFNHSHADQNHFIITAGGDKLIWDAGYYDSYLSDHHRNYSRLSLAHNTLLVDGIGQVPHQAGTDGKITRFELDGRTLRVEGDASEPLIYGGRLERFVRTIEYRDEREFIIRDDIFSSELSRISWLLHSAFPIVYDPGEQSFVITGERYRAKGKFETSEPLEVTLKTHFPVPPDRPATQIFDVASVYPEQYHLELKTKEKIETWQPTLTLTLSRIEE